MTAAGIEAVQHDVSAHAAGGDVSTGRSSIVLGDPPAAAEPTLTRAFFPHRYARPASAATVWLMKRRATGIGLMLVVLVMTIGTGVPFGQERVEVEPDSEGPARAVIRIANTERSAHGLGTLEEHAALRKAAEWMAGDMAKHEAFDHTDSRGRDFAERLRAFGYDDARLMAENIGKGAESAQAAVQGWLSSGPHRRNLLDPEARDVGVGYAIGDRDRQPYWVLDLGVRFDVQK